MAGNENKLSQNHIDTLFAQSQGGGADSGSRGQAAAPPQQPAPPERIESLENRIKHLETQIANIESASQPAPQDLKPLVDYVKELDAQLKSILNGLQKSVGYNLGQNFRCKSCGAQGFVAIPVRCTNCGKESWWGWWS